MWANSLIGAVLGTLLLGTTTAGNGLPSAPPPQAAERCHTDGLSLAAGRGDAAVGHEGATFRFTNNLDAPCTFYGYVGAQLLDGDDHALPTDVIRGGGYLFRDPGPELVTVPPGGSATFGMEWVHVPVGAETTCPTSSSIEVTPPDEFTFLTIPATIMACGGGTLHVTAVQPAT